jgi:hypothetical protein
LTALVAQVMPLYEPMYPLIRYLEEAMLRPEAHIER